jgi:hypothetical protein
MVCRSVSEGINESGLVGAQRTEAKLKLFAKKIHRQEWQADVWSTPLRLPHSTPPTGLAGDVPCHN